MILCTESCYKQWFGVKMDTLVISCDLQAVVYPIIGPKNIIVFHSEFCDIVTMELISSIHTATGCFGSSASLAKHI